MKAEREQYKRESRQAVRAHGQDRIGDGLAATSDLLMKRGVAADWVAADASKDSDIEALANKALEKLGHVDILVNNAGASWGAPAEDHPIEAWDKVFDLNVRGLSF